LLIPTLTTVDAFYASHHFDQSFAGFYAVIPQPSCAFITTEKELIPA
jgi:hypothetical protein